MYSVYFTLKCLNYYLSPYTIAKKHVQLFDHSKLEDKFDEAKETDDISYVTFNWPVIRTYLLLGVAEIWF